MHPRAYGLGVAFGAAGLAVTLTSVLPSLTNSLLLGSSVGLIVACAIGWFASLPITPGEPRSTPEERLMQLVRVRKKEMTVEHERILDTFDALLSRVGEIDDPMVNGQVTENFERFVDRLTAHYPEWDAEGRLRTYVLMKKIAGSLNPQNAEAYLEMAYKTLLARGTEATEISHMTLNGKVERIYRDPESEGAHRLAGTLLLMNRGDDDYAREMVVEAIHLWSDRRFAMLKADFASIPLLGTKEEESILDLLEKEMEKTKRAGDAEAARRARDLWMTIIVADPGRPPTH